MRIGQVTGLFCPCLTEEPEQTHVHENACKSQRILKGGRGRDAIRECRVDPQERKRKEHTDDRGAHQEIIPVRILHAVEEVAERRDEIVRPRPGPESVVVPLEMEFAFIAELREEPDGHRREQ